MSPRKSSVDIPFLAVGAPFLGLAFLEFLLPGGLGDDRIAIKVLSGIQITLAVCFGCVSLRSARLCRPVPACLTALFIWLCSVALLNSESKVAGAYACAMFLYWYSLFVFAYVRIQLRPHGADLLLRLVAASLLVWLAALAHSVDIKMEIARRSAEFQIQDYLSYYMLALLPSLLLMRNTMIHTLGLMLISFGAVYSLKRGAVLALALASTGSGLLHIAISPARRDRVKAMRAVVLLSVLAVGMGALFFCLNPDAVKRRIDRKDTGGRPEIWRAIGKQLSKATAFELAFGHGYLATVRDTEFNAHNDWLLLQYDYGSVGVLLMLSVYISLAGCLYAMWRHRSRLAVSLFCAIVILACVQMYSAALYVKTMGFLTFAIGLAVGSFEGRAFDAQPRLLHGHLSAKCFPAVAERCDE